MVAKVTLEWFKKLQSWFSGSESKQGREKPDILLYYRTNCHLCDVAEQQLLTWQKKYGFQLKVEDIDAEGNPKDKYGQCVPVVLVNGKLRFRGKINQILFQRLMEKLRE